MSTRMEFENLINTRDLGGMKTMDGRTVKKGKLIRSGRLIEASPDDVKKLCERIDTIVDFRTDQEFREQPDPDMDGVSPYSLPIIEEAAAGITQEEATQEYALVHLATDEKKAEAMMCRMYEGIGASRFSASQYSKFVRILLEDHEKAVLWHCSAGKDRAGFAALIVEKLLGIDEETIRKDYLYTNVCRAEDTEHLIETMWELLPEGANVKEEAIRALMEARETYLDTLLEAIDETYGSFNAYIKEGLQLSEADIERFQDLYLEG